MTDPARRQLEAELLLRLNNAAEEFRRAKSEQKRLQEQSMDLGLAHPDGRIALAKGLEIYNKALTNPKFP